jgi:hypothetical protein
MSARNLPGGGGLNGGRRVRLTTLPPSVNQFSREDVGASTSHSPMDLHDLLGYLPVVQFWYFGLLAYGCIVWWLVTDVSDEYTASILKVPRKTTALIIDVKLGTLYSLNLRYYLMCGVGWGTSYESDMSHPKLARLEKECTRKRISFKCLYSTYKCKRPNVPYISVLWASYRHAVLLC